MTTKSLDSNSQLKHTLKKLHIPRHYDLLNLRSITYFNEQNIKKFNNGLKSIFLLLLISNTPRHRLSWPRTSASTQTSLKTVTAGSSTGSTPTINIVLGICSESLNDTPDSPHLVAPAAEWARSHHSS